MARMSDLTDEQRLDRIREIKARMDADRAELLTLIRDVFPETRGEPPVRGRLTEVVKASGWTRTYVADIRDGKVGE
jgi:hypothetical protein